MTSVPGDERLFAVEVSKDEAPRPWVPVGEAKTFRRYDQDQCFFCRSRWMSGCPKITRPALSPRSSRTCSTSRRSTRATPRRQAPRHLTRG